MAIDQRWNRKVFVPLNILQLLSNLVGFSFCCVEVWWVGSWDFGWSLCINTMAALWTITSIALWKRGRLLPIAPVVINGFLILGFTVGIAVTSIYDALTDFVLTQIIQSIFHIASFIQAIVVLHKTRTDIDGTKYNRGEPYMVEKTSDCESNGQHGLANDQNSQVQAPLPVHRVGAQFVPCVGDVR
ncbi:hypothetical protein FPQ18DRAFT_338817 [Pyronema domesticum]|nr:hypothetical protein FPQ18DRAFT_338817 [Pyronema domesticum]